MQPGSKGRCNPMNAVHVGHAAILRNSQKPAKFPEVLPQRRKVRAETA
jgi:hypothetical protein